MEIKDLKKYHKNPRKITETQYKELGKTLEEFGDLSGVVVNIRNNEVIGGNQRTAFFKEHSNEVSIIKHTEGVPPNAQGTTAIGYIYFRGGQFSYREVDWDEKKEARANIIANKAGGFWDNDILANEFDYELLMDSGFQDFELGMFKALQEDSERETDTNTLDHTLDTYLDGSIKQVVLYFKKEEYDGIIERLEKIQQHLGANDFTQVFEELLNAYENSKSN